jgi:hypothetical protein
MWADPPQDGGIVQIGVAIRARICTGVLTSRLAPPRRAWLSGALVARLALAPEQVGWNEGLKGDPTLGLGRFSDRRRELRVLHWRAESLKRA